VRIQSSTYPSRAGEDARWIARQDPVVWGDATRGPLTAEEVSEYGERGFLTFDDRFDVDEVVRFESELNRLAQRPELRHRAEVIREPDSDEVRSIFAVHTLSDLFRDLADDPRLVGPAEQVLGSRVYVHQSRINLKPAFRGRDFFWHSDFETWHVEDGMPRMRAVSFSIQLSENRHDNGSLMIVPGSHRHFLGCPGETPERNYEHSLRAQTYGVPDDGSLTRLITEHGITTVLGQPGSAVMFDSNCMHGSNSNITPFPRTNIFIVYNSVDNALTAPVSGQPPRPSYIAERPTI
jgi:ectoine hydroxylase